MTDDDLRFSAREFATLLNWYMVSDPWPISQPEEDPVKEMLNTEARARGYDGWVQAYHEFGLSEEEAHDEQGDALRDAADAIGDVAENVPEHDFDEETLAEYEEEFGDVPSLGGILSELATTTRHIAILVDVAEEDTDD